MRRSHTTIILLSILLIANVGCRRTDHPPTPDPAPSPSRPPTQSTYRPPATTGAAPGYVGQALCFSCHADIAKTYAQLGMAKAFYKPTNDNIIEDFADNHFYHAPSDRHYEMIRRDGKLFVTRYQTDPDGARYNEFELEATHVIGSGHHSRGYVHLSDSGEMVQMPIAWYTQEQRWGMAPGYDNAHHSGFTRPVTRSCMFCHNAYPDVPTGSDRFGQPDRFPQNLPEGIGCERCHGPGAEHVRLAANDDATPQSLRESIVNPTRLEPQLQNDVCMQCHLQPTSKLTSFVRRFDQPDYAYQPAQPLHEYMVHFDFDTDPTDNDRFEIDSAAYRMERSTCFQSSDGTLTCLTCHDPHRKIPDSEKTAYYRDRCFQCHKLDACTMDAMTAAASNTAADDCVTCHMPKRRTDDVIHVIMTDHEIQRVPPARDLLAPLTETGSPRAPAVRFLHPERAPSGSLREVYLAIPGVKDGSPGAIDRLRSALHLANPTAIEPYIELASAELTNGFAEQAEASFARITQEAPDLAMGHTNRGVALIATGRLDAGINALRTALKIDPNLADAHYNLASALARAGRDQEAVTHYERALQLRPLHAKCRLNLGNLRARSKHYEQAVTHFRAALAIDPDLTRACENLGTALLRLDDYTAALQTWRRGMRHLPDRGRIAHKLARTLLIVPDETLRNAREAVESATIAARSQPSNPRLALTLAAALLNDGQNENAVRVALRANQLGAPPGDCTLIAAVAARRLGRPDADDLHTQATQSPATESMDKPLRTMLLELADRLFAPPKPD